MAPRGSIEAEVRRRSIRRLYHFTPEENARGILTHRLLSRQDLETREYSFMPTDMCRLDERLDAVSVTIEDINWDMLRSKQKLRPRGWMILEVDASVLWTHRCLYCWQSAASSEIRNHWGSRKGPWAFQRMFEDRGVGVSGTESYRASRGLGSQHPTERGAEVQVLDPIGTDLILDVTVESARAKVELEALMQEIGRERPVVLCVGIRP